MGLSNVDLLMVLGFPLLNEQDLVGVLLAQILIVTDAAVLGPDGFQNAGVLYLLDKGLPLTGQAVEFYINGVHIHFSL